MAETFAKSEDQLVPFRRIPRFGLFHLLKPSARKEVLVYEKRDDTMAWTYAHVGKDKTPSSQGGGRILFKRVGELQLEGRELVLPYGKAPTK